MESFEAIQRDSRVEGLSIRMLQALPRTSAYGAPGAVGRGAAAAKRP